MVINYVCDLCNRTIAVEWKVGERDSGGFTVQNPRLLHRVLGDYDFDHVPESVQTEITEALDCLSVNAFNGFAAVCRRAVQAICTDLGAATSTKVQDQLGELFETMGLDEEDQELARQVMLTGHDGAHPHLPEVDQPRANILLSLIQDLTY